jgi:hypothetical protein
MRTQTRPIIGTVMARHSRNLSAAARISDDVEAVRPSLGNSASSSAVARISHDAVARGSSNATSRISHDAPGSASDAVIVRIPHDASVIGADDETARISHDPAAAASRDVSARISHDPAAAARADTLPAASLLERLLGTAKDLANQIIRNPSARRWLVLAKTLGITGVLLGGLQQAAITYTPQFVDPIAEFLYLRHTMAAYTHEPDEHAPGQGKITTVAGFNYEFRISDLDARGTVRGRFRGLSDQGKPDPRWWYVSGRSDGKRAMLTYRNEKGDVLGELSLQRSKDGSVWAGHLIGIDRSISDTDLIQSPIMVAQSDYDLPRLKADDFLDESPVLVKSYAH